MDSRVVNITQFEIKKKNSLIFSNLVFRIAYESTKVFS